MDALEAVNWIVLKSKTCFILDGLKIALAIGKTASLRLMFYARTSTI